MAWASRHSHVCTFVVLFSYSFIVLVHNEWKWKKTWNQSLQLKDRRRRLFQSKRYVGTRPKTSPIDNRTIVARSQSDVATCSCENDLSSEYCCQRALILVHKMGVTAGNEIKDELFPFVIESTEIMKDHRNGQLFEAAFETPVMDYRHALLTRNWFEAIISGYLYHKSGRECWLDWFGNPNHQGWLLQNRLESWEQRLRRSYPRSFAESYSWTPGDNRDLCTYLANVTEDEGLRVYTAWAMTAFMDPLLEFYQRRLETEKANGWNRTVYLCLENTSSPNGHATTVRRLQKWFFPDWHYFRKTRLQKPKYAGGHATSQDPILRTRLHNLLKNIDDMYFNGTISRGSALFGCGEKGSTSFR